MAESLSKESGLVAAYQVDAMNWPTDCTKIALAADEQLDCLTGGVEKCLRDGQKVIGVGACREASGCTTLLLCAARRMAQEHHRVAIVDGNFAQPEIARQLSVLPEAGWESAGMEGEALVVR